MPETNPDHELALARLQHELALARLQNDYQLARLGLQGTLYGAVASLIAIVTIAVVQAVIGRYVVEGKAFAAMVGVIVVPITFYGAFIFNRALNVSAKVEKDALNVSAKVEKEGGSFSATSSEKTERPQRPIR
jgi:hypothetical protein